MALLDVFPIFVFKIIFYLYLYMTTEKNLITKVCTTIIALNATLGGMAIDYKKAVKTQKFDAQSMIEMQKMQQEELDAPSAAKALRGSYATNANATTTIRALVKLHDGLEASVLTDQGFKVEPVCQNFGVVSLSVDSLQVLAEQEEVERISFGERKMDLMLSRANASTGVDILHRGRASNNLSEKEELLNRPYTGKGTMIGIFDDGIDPNHAMFLDKDDVSRFRIFSTSKTKMTDVPSKIAAYKTDNRYSSHATHVSGIAAGNFQGDGFLLQGVAPEADIAFGRIMSQPSELTRLTTMAEYCKEHNLRLVTNMSYGSAYGPHDGSDLFAQALEGLINKYDIIACVSAGNYADQPLVEKHTFTGEETDELKGLYNLEKSYNLIKNYIVTANSSPIDINLIVFDPEKQEIVKSYKLVSQGEVQEITWGDEFIKSTIHVAEEEIHDGLSGYAINCDKVELGNASYLVGYTIQGEKGQLVTSYADSKCPFLEDFKDWTADITHNGTVNDLGCSKEVICVGSYNTTSSINLFNGKTKSITDSNSYNWGVEDGEISYFSSFGTRYDGLELPHICAPGAFLESSFNRYSESGTSSITRKGTFHGEVYAFSAMSGTSMSSPYMAGVAALWLEANPKLTHQEIKNIAMMTATNDPNCNEENHFKEEGRQAGAGKVNAYAGLMYILTEDAATLVETPTEKSFLVRSTSSTDYEAFCAGATSLSATLFNIEGKQIKSTSINGNTISVSTAYLPKGIYILRLNGNNKAYQAKIAVK